MNRGSPAPRLVTACLRRRTRQNHRARCFCRVRRQRRTQGKKRAERESARRERKREREERETEVEGKEEEEREGRRTNGQTIRQAGRKTDRHRQKGRDRETTQRYRGVDRRCNAAPAIPTWAGRPLSDPFRLDGALERPAVSARLTANPRVCSSAGCKRAMTDCLCAPSDSSGGGPAPCSAQGAALGASVRLCRWAGEHLLLVQHHLPRLVPPLRPLPAAPHSLPRPLGQPGLRVRCRRRLYACRRLCVRLALGCLLAPHGDRVRQGWLFFSSAQSVADKGLGGVEENPCSAGSALLRP